MAIVDNVEQDRTQENPCDFCIAHREIIKDNKDCRIIEPVELNVFAEVDLYGGLRSNRGYAVLQVRHGTFPINYCPVCGLRLND